MNIGENILFYRKKAQMSQENLSEKVGVTRQTISNWELEESYPDVKQLIKLAEIFEVSLDNLVNTQIENKIVDDEDNKITIVSKIENTIVYCNKVKSSQKFKGGKSSPKYALYAEDDTSSIFLGWYENKEQISEEINEIAQAISCKQSIYELKHNVEVDKKLFGMCLKLKNN